MNRVRNLTMLFILAVWGTYVVTTIARGEKVDLPLWGVPPTVFLSLYRSPRKDTDRTPASESQEVSPHE